MVDFDRLPRNSYPLAIVIIGVSLLLHITLISSQLSGYDIHIEYYYQNLVDRGIGSSRLFVRYVFVDSQKFPKENINQEHLCKFMSLFTVLEKYVLYVGRLDNWDGAGDMFEITKQIYSKVGTAKFVLIREGPLRPRVNSFIAENDLNQLVFQVHRIDYQAMPFVYYGAEILIIPAHPPQGGVGRITLEAPSMEVPVIAHDWGNFVELLKVTKLDI